MIHLNNKKILIIGDIILDKYVMGTVDRVSREAPVIVLKVKSEDYKLGGAANVANNLASLGVPTTIIGLVGKDQESSQLTQIFKDRGINADLIYDNTRRTIVKIRTMSQNQQLFRIDYEDDLPIESLLQDKIIHQCLSQIDNHDAVVISDYGRQLLSEKLVQEIIKKATHQNKAVIIDPKPYHKNYYRGATVLTPNIAEASGMVKRDIITDEDIINAGQELKNELGSHILLTCSEKGMVLFSQSGDIHKIPTIAKDVFDVTGAGDTVVAVVALALAHDIDLKRASQWANAGAGIVVGQFGAATITPEELQDIIKKFP